MTLDEFLEEAKTDIEKFEWWWREKNKNNPDGFPLKFEDDNFGIWWEMLNDFNIVGE